MSTFTEAEVRYLHSQALGRLATVGPDGAPHVKPVGVFYDADTETIVIGSHGGMARTRKYRDVQDHPDVAVVVDDLAALDPWTPRGLEIRGHAETLETGGEEIGRKVGAGFEFDPAWIRITPRRIVTWGIDGSAYAATARSVA